MRRSGVFIASFSYARCKFRLLVIKHAARQKYPRTLQTNENQQRLSATTQNQPKLSKLTKTFHNQKNFVHRFITAKGYLKSSIKSWEEYSKTIIFSVNNQLNLWSIFLKVFCKFVNELNLSWKLFSYSVFTDVKI